MAVSAETAELLAFLAQPRLRSEVAAHVGVSAADRPRLDTFLDRMAAADILVRCAAPEGLPGRRAVRLAVPVAGT